VGQRLFFFSDPRSSAEIRNSLKGMIEACPRMYGSKRLFFYSNKTVRKDVMMRKQGGLRRYQERSVDGVDDAGTASHLPCSRFVCKRGLSEYEECFKQIFEVRLLEREEETTK